MLRMTWSITRGILAAVFLEHGLCELFRDVDGDGLNRSRIGVEAFKKDAPSVDHRRQNCTLKKKLPGRFPQTIQTFPNDTQ